MRTTILWIIVLIVLALIGGLYLVTLERAKFGDRTLAQRAAELDRGAGVLEDSARRLPALTSGLEPSTKSPAAEALARQAARLREEASILRGATPLPPGEELAREYKLKAAALRDSAGLMRTELVNRHGSLTRDEERRLDQLERQAGRLETVAERFRKKGALAGRENVDLYQMCTDIYGEGAKTCGALRANITTE